MKRPTTVKLDSEEEETLRRVAAGDRESFRPIVAKYQDMVFSLVMRQVGDREISQDLTQEIFVKAYLGIKRFRFESSFSTWITRIAINHLNSYFVSSRHRNRKLTESFDVGKHDLASEGTESEEQEQRAINRFRAALGGMKAHLRSVIVLCGIEGKSYAEAAELLNVPIGTIRSRLSKARLVLKETLFEEGGR